MRVLRRLWEMLKSSPDLDNIHELTEKLNKTANLAQSEYQDLKKKHTDLNCVVHNTDGYIWRKDRDHKYTFANHALCTNILVPDMSEIRSTEECTSAIEGHTDEEIFSRYTERTGDVNSFWVTMALADRYAIKERKSIKMIEFGKVRGKHVTLQSVRSPVFDSGGAYIGLNGFAIDLSDTCMVVYNQVDNWMKSKLVSRIHPYLYVISEEARAKCQYDQKIFKFSSIDDVDRMFEKDSKLILIDTDR